MFPGLIRKNLNAWYRDGYAVIKELLQNADDAGANLLNFGWSPGIPHGPDHELLTGPAIFVINDGPFTPEDEQAIRRFGLGNKPDNRNKIGQFGLGLKSVFHLCEAFLYVSDKYCDLCNPWSGIPGHPAQERWDNFSLEAQDSIIEYINPFIPASSREGRSSEWLCIWLPLRRKQWAAGDMRWYFPGDFHGDHAAPPAEVFSNIEDSVATMLPMLRHLSRVQVWILDQHGGIDRRTSVELVHGSRCVYRGGTSAKSVGSVLSGQLRVEKPLGTATMTYGGMQCTLNDPDLTTLQSDAERWPRIEGFHEGTGFCIVPAKNDQHCAAYFCRQPAVSSGRLRLRWAVFLPLSQDNVEEHEIESPDDVTLTLHGWFFVDPGRQWADVFHRSNDEDSSVEHRWNTLLAERGTLQLLIPALSQLTRTTPPNDPLPRTLTEAISQSHLFNQHSLAICSRESWAYILHPSGGSWRSLASSQEVFELPAPTPGQSECQPFRVFPRLITRVSEGSCFTMKDTPRLCTRRMHEWRADQVCDLLASVSWPESSGEAELLDYLVRFLANLGCQVIVDIGVQGEIHRLVRSAIQNLTKRPHSSVDMAIQRLMAFVPPEARISIKYNPELIGESRRIARLLQIATDMVIVVPQPLDNSESPAAAHINPSLATDLLTIVDCLQAETQQTDSFISLRSLVAIDIIRAAGLVGEELRRFAKGIGHLCLFPVTSFRANKRVCASLSHLLEAHEKRLLFVQMPSLLKLLQRCLAHDDVLFLQQREVAELMNDIAAPVPSGQSVSVVAAVATRPPLSDIAACTDLFGQLANQLPSIDAQAIAALRYLLHRFHESALTDAEEPAILFAASDRDCDGPHWRAFAEATLAVLGQSWRLVPLDTANRVPESLWSYLNIVRLGPSSACDLAEELLAYRSTPAGLSDAMRQFCSNQPQYARQVVLDWPKTDESTRILKRLPLFTDSRGHCAEVTPETRMPGGFVIEDPDGLPEVRILAIDPSDVEYAVRLGILVPQLTAKDAVSRVLKAKEPAKQCHFIINTLCRHDRLYKELGDELRNSPWLPTIEGQPTNPGGIVHVPDCDRVIDAIAARTGHFRGINAIDPEFRTRVDELKQRSSFLQLLVTGNDAIATIGRAMQKCQDFHFGLKGLFLTEPHLESLGMVFADGVMEQSVLPGITLISSFLNVWAKTADRKEQLREHVVSKLQENLTTQRTVGVLQRLASAQEEPLSVDRLKILDLFNLYLKEARDRPEFGRDILPHIRLRNKKGQWVQAITLTSDGSNVPPENQVSDEHRGIVDTPCGACSPSPVDAEEDKGDGTFDVEGYLRTEFSDCPGPVLGFIVALFGGQDPWSTLSKQFTGPFPLDVVLRSVRWFSCRWFSSWNDALSRCRVRILRADPDIQKVLNLAGHWIAVRRNGPVRSLVDGFHGSQYTLTPDGRQEYNVFLTPVPTKDMNRKAKLELLCGTAQSLLVNLYGQPAECLAEPWRVLTDTGQLGISVAQRLILESSLFHLRGQLGVRSTPELTALFQRRDTARTRQAVASELGDAKGPDEVRDEQTEIDQELRHLLTDNTPPAVQAQEQILDAVRDRLSRTSYTMSSIPFELFQNADDAVVELSWLLGNEQLGPSASLCVVVVDEDAISLCHWGRAINQYGVPGYCGRNGLEKGFERDLEKMLVLSSSDKGLDAGPHLTTGKFGLGFKSVFFATDSPEVLSGPSLCFRVTGGVFPQELAESESALLREILLEFGGRPDDGTVVRLPLRQTVRPECVVSRFRSLAHMLVCFSRCVRRLFLQIGEKTSLCQWQDVEVLGVGGVYVGTVRSFDESPQTEGTPLRVLLFRNGTESLLMAVGPRGFSWELLRGAPTIWVTTPTEHKLHLGLCLNGQFDLNPGRTQLRSTPENRSRADAFGRWLGERLLLLFDAAENSWDCLRQQLELQSCLAADLWRSLWDVAVRRVLENSGDRDVVDLVKRVLLHTSDVGVSRLLRERHALPTYLSGAYNTLTCWSTVRYVLKGVLTRPEVLEAVAYWPWFEVHVHPGAVVHEDVDKMMQRLQPTASLHSLHLLDVLTEELGLGNQVMLDAAHVFGLLIDRDFLSDMANDSCTSGEHRNLLTYLRGLFFRNHRGDWCLCSTLLVIHKEGPEHDEERLRAAFAPSDRILCKEYSPNAVLFFLACRGALHAPASEMAEWAIAASDDPQKKKAVEDYLVEGDLARELSKALENHPRFKDTWLAQLPHDENLRSDPNRCGAVLSRLGLMQAMDIRPSRSAYRAVLLKGDEDVLRRRCLSRSSSLNGH